MDPRRSGSNSHRREWHARIERYTPDGTLGRWLLGAPLGVVGLWLLALTVFEIPRWGLTLAALFWTPVLLGAAIPTLVLSVLLLWPVYISLIGNIESPRSYSVSGARDGTGTTASDGELDDRSNTPNGTTVASDDSPTATDDPLEKLKRRYAAGELSESEFERRLEAHLEGGGREASTETTAPDTAASTATERIDDRE